jgi:outer membrane biosynthesis protein TonB
VDLPFYREYDLPWTSDSRQERKFQRLLGAIFIAVAVLSLLWPFIPTPEPDPYEVIEIPPRIAQLLLEEKPLPPPPPPEPEPEEEEPEPEPDEEPEQVVEEVEPEPEIIPEPEPEPEINQEEVALEQAQAAMMPFAEDLADLVDQDLLDAVDDRDLTASVGESERNERSMITSKAGVASGGINTASLSRNTGGTGIAGRSTTQVASPVEGLGDSAGGARRTGTSGKASRSREEIELVFDKNKGAIFALYNRALRMDPSLEGKLVLRLTIAPDGSVTFCEVVSSELGDPELESKLVARVKLFRFAERDDVEPITTTKPIDFFPA